MTKIKLCEKMFCIYWVDNKCILDTISIDISGNCGDCIIVGIDEEYLITQRNALLKKIWELIKS